MNTKKDLKKPETPQEKLQRIAAEKISEAKRLFGILDEKLSKEETSEKESKNLKLLRLAVSNYKTGTEIGMKVGCKYLYEALVVDRYKTPALAEELKKLLRIISKRDYTKKTSQIGFYFGHPKAK